MARNLGWTVLGAVLGLWGVVAPARAAEPEAWTRKVDPWVLSSGAGGSTEFLVVLREQADLRAAALLPSKEAKGELVARTLRETATRSQSAVLADLATLGVEVRPFWVANMIWVRGDLQVARRMAERPDVARVSANPSVPLQRVPRAPGVQPEQPTGIEWGIAKTNAPAVWALGFKGAGVVVAGQDTGYQWTHPALKNQYRGWNGSTADHNYNWHDAIHSGGGVCGANATAPCDDDEHGTHTMGTMVGDDGGSNQIGMAPMARWIGCRNMDQGNGTPATYAECFQWFIAPTNIAGLNPDPSKAPHVINNSWGCPPSEGCTDPLVLKTVVDNTRAAGIVVVVSAGNDGSSCETVSDPAAIYDSAFSVGATSSSDAIASFSSRGPVTVDGSNRPKPDISAPGVNIRSSVPTNSYGTMDGTSMAGPHVVGHVALLLSAIPQWKGHVDWVEQRITQSAVPRTTTQSCGGVSGNTIPNNTFGWGRIDALASVSVADLGIAASATPDPVLVGNELTYRIVASNHGPVAATGVTAALVLSARVAYVSASSGCSHAAGTVTCTFGTVDKGALPEKVVVVRATSAGAVRSSVSITGTLVDPITTDNQALVWTSAVNAAPVTVTPGGTGSGSVTSTPPGIACPTACGANFQVGQSLVLHAVAGDGSSFTGWSGEGCAGTNDCSLTIDSSTPRAVTATFSLGLAPAFTSGAGTTFWINVPGTFTVTAVGSPTPSLSAAGPLPSDLTFTDQGNGTATLAGPVHVTGSYPLTFTAHNGVGADASQSFTLEVTWGPGDTNGDGSTNVSDVFYLLDYLVSGGPAPIGTGDVNADGQVTVVDVFYLINYLFAGGPPPA